MNGLDERLRVHAVSSAGMFPFPAAQTPLVAFFIQTAAAALDEEPLPTLQSVETDTILNSTTGPKSRWGWRHEQLPCYPSAPFTRTVA